MSFKAFLFFTILFFPTILYAEDSSTDDMTELAWVDRDFLILGSTKNYATADKIANDAARVLKLPLHLRGLSPVANAAQPELSFNKMYCEESGREFPCYFPRGRAETSEVYISIENTSYYKNLKDHHFIVVAAITQPNDPKIKALLKTAKKNFRDAYVKKAQIYMGCMH